MIESLQFNCTTCPSECLLTVEVERDANGAVVAVRSVTGNNCPRGDKFAHQELTCPMRVLTTTVAVSGGDEALLPVRTAEAIPLALHAQAMDLIRGVSRQGPHPHGRRSAPRTSQTPAPTSSPAWTSTLASVANLGRGSFSYPAIHPAPPQLR